MDVADFERRCRWLAGALLVFLAGPAAAQDPPRYTETVDVARILLDVRVIDPRGRPLLGLEPANFEVRIDGKPARVESVQHVSGKAVVASGSNPAVELPGGAQDRLVVFLFQKSLHRTRMPGLMQMLRELQRSLVMLPASDQVAVLRFDSRLELLQDFSRNRELLRRAFEHDVLFGDGTTDANAQDPSLRAVLDRERSDPSFSMEASLLRIAEALQLMPGPKSVVLVGHGFGELSRMGISLDRSYDKARAALQRARVSVFCLDVTNADYHTLEMGLQTVADDTGGLYQRTHVFSEAALGRVIAALEGQYVLFVEHAALGRGSHRLDVRLKGRDGVVLSPHRYVTK